MSTLTLIEIRIPHNAYRDDDVLVTAEWRKQVGYVVTHGSLRYGLFAASTAAKLYPSAKAAVRAARHVAGRLYAEMQD